MIPYLLPSLMSRYGEVNCIKKGCSYFMFSTESLIFKDALNFTSPCTLSAYLSQWSVEERKSIWPYTFFNSVEDIKKCTTFPPISAFYNEMKNQHCSPSSYVDEMITYQNHKMLPDGHPDKMVNMECWLKRYNVLDVQPLCDAIETSFQTLYSIFGVDPSRCFSLPGLAIDVMSNLYDPEAPLSYSFNDRMDHIRQLFRSNQTGGLVNVFSRLTDVRKNPPTDTPHNALYAPDGSRFTKIIFLDFNSLYLTAQGEFFPTTPGM